MSYKRELKKSVYTLAALEKSITLTPQERAWFEQENRKRLPLFISPIFFKKIVRDKENSKNPIRLQSIPTVYENYVAEYEKSDPLCEERFSPIAGVVHRYENRVLLYASHRCAHNCRHCFRGAIPHTKKNLFDHLDELEEYLVSKPTICEVLLSGADPLIHEDRKLELILKRIKHAQKRRGKPLLVRICTRIPFTLPSRVTYALLRMLDKYRPLWFILHINHEDEFSPQSIKALKKIQRASFPMVSQTVLLRGVNDSPKTLATLMEKLLFFNIKPYYLFQGDLAEGTKHFRVPINEGLKIVNELKKHISGLAMPNYYVDLPNGGGKIPLTKSYFYKEEENSFLFKNEDGDIFSYPKE